MKKTILRVIAGLSMLCVIGYGGIMVFLFFQETELVFDTKYGRPPVNPPADSLHLNYQRVVFRSEDGVRLAGWTIFSSRDTSRSAWLLFCHGNGSNISFPDYILRYALFSKLGLNVLVFDFRGYGESQGSCSETGFYRDATAAYNYLTKTRNVPPERIVIYGHSLGTGVAIDLAARVPAACLVVESGFQSIPEVGQRRYPFIPMGLLVRNKFMSIDKINRIAAPKMFIHSIDDEIFPIAESKALFEKAVQPKIFLEIKGKHSEAALVSRAAFCGGVSAFLAATTAR